MEKQKSVFGRKIELLLAENGMSQNRFAKKIGVLPNNIPQLKRSKRPTPRMIKRVSLAFDVPVSHFIEV